MTPGGSAPSVLLERYEELLLHHTNATLRRGMLASSVLGLSAALIIFVLLQIKIVQGLEIPMIWALTGGVLSGAIHLLAREERIRGRVRYLVVLFFVSMPSALFVVAHFWLPSGAATYITGPASYLYFVFIVLSGFFFDSRLPLFAGVMCAAQYGIAYWMDRGHLVALAHPDALLLQDFTSAPIYLFKTQMMLAAGVAVAVLASHTRKLIGGVLEAEERRREIDRLFGQYVSPEVKKRLLSWTRESLGERKKVVVLFADIRSFSSISEDRPPESLVRQLNEYLDRMVGCIQREGGVIDKFIGDAIMATFGGLLDLERPCDAAVRAARAMLVELQQLNVAWQARGLPAFRIGVGIHFGEVLLGPIGSENRKEFAAIGDTVNIASRLESLTKEYETPILISEAVRERLEPTARERLQEKGIVRVKGRLGELRIYSIDE